MRAAARSRGPRRAARRRGGRPAPTPSRCRRVRAEPRAGLGERRRGRLADEPVARDPARPRAGRPRRSSSRPASPPGTPRRARSRSPRRPARSRRRGSARRGRSAPPPRRGRRRRRGRRGPCSRASSSSRSRSGPSPAITQRSDGSDAPAPRAAGRPASPGRGARPRGRSRRTRRSGTAAPAAGAASTSANEPRRALEPVRRRSREIAKSLRASPSATRSRRCTARRSARPSGDSSNWPSSVRSSSYACRNWCRSQTTLFGCRTAYEGNFVAITRSIGRPSASSRSSSRQRNACVSTRSPGYHLNGTVTSSASWPRSRSSSTRRSLRISAPPRMNGTWGRQTAILMCARRSRSRAAPKSSSFSRLTFAAITGSAGSTSRSSGAFR